MRSADRRRPAAEGRAAAGRRRRLHRHRRRHRPCGAAHPRRAEALAGRRAAGPARPVVAAVALLHRLRALPPACVRCRVVVRLGNARARGWRADAPRLSRVRTPATGLRIARLAHRADARPRARTRRIVSLLPTQGLRRHGRLAGRRGAFTLAKRRARQRFAGRIHPRGRGMRADAGIDLGGGEFGARTGGALARPERPGADRGERLAKLPARHRFPREDAPRDDHLGRARRIAHARDHRERDDGAGGCDLRAARQAARRRRARRHRRFRHRLFLVRLLQDVAGRRTEDRQELRRRHHLLGAGPAHRPDDHRARAPLRHEGRRRGRRGRGDAAGVAGARLRYGAGLPLLPAGVPRPVRARMRRRQARAHEPPVTARRSACRRS